MSSAALQIEVVSNTASPAVANLLTTLKNPHPVLSVGANAVRQAMQDHFRARPPNKQGWPTSRLWSRIARMTAVSEVTDTDATISVSHPAILQRVYGGTILPKRGKMLSLPASAAAYAAGSPREGGGPSNLTFVYAEHPDGGWRPALAVQMDVMKEVGKPRKDGTRRQKLVHTSGTVWYWLVRQAKQIADPTALPPPGILSDTAASSMLTFLNTRYGARTQL